MRSASVVMLAAGICWASPAAARPPRTHALAPETADALAKERVRGQVLVSGLAFASEAAANNVVANIDAQAPVAMRVVRDKGKVIQVATKVGADCVGGLDGSYELTLFVPRSSLVPRTAEPVIGAFDDGTAYAVDRGAPVKVNGSSVTWADALLEQTAVAPPARLAYSLSKPYTRAALPEPAPGERLVCDAGPMTKEDYLARKQAERDRDAKRSNAAARRVADARAARRSASAKTDAVDGLLDLALHDGTTSSSAILANDTHDLPYCSVAPASAKAAPRLDGATLAWSTPRTNEHVYRVSGGYLADVGVTCGRMRVTVDAPAVRRAAAAGSEPRTAGAKQKTWIPKPGPVFWPDGTKAGKYTGRGVRFMRATERENLICVDVQGVAEEVCHRRADVTIEK